jgi:hypothetical protein
MRWCLCLRRFVYATWVYREVALWPPRANGAGLSPTVLLRRIEYAYPNGIKNLFIIYTVPAAPGKSHVMFRALRNRVPWPVRVLFRQLHRRQPQLRRITHVSRRCPPGGQPPVAGQGRVSRQLIRPVCTAWGRKGKGPQLPGNPPATAICSAQPSYAVAFVLPHGTCTGLFFS